MSNSNQYKSSFWGNLVVMLGCAFFLYIFLAGWGTSSDYSNINDTSMDCEAILKEVDRVGITQYIFNGKPDAPEHFYTAAEKRQIEYQKAKQEYEIFLQQQQQANNYDSRQNKRNYGR